MENEEVIHKYKDALKTIEHYDLKPIEIEFDDGEFYEGFEFEIYNDGNIIAPPRWETWLIIHCPEENVEDLDHRFDGIDFDLYGESRGDDFIFMHKAERSPSVKFIYKDKNESTT